MHINWRTAAAAIATLLLVGCETGGFGSSSAPERNTVLPATATRMPRYTDALTGLYTAPAGAVPTNVAINYYAPGGGTGKPGRAVLTMALVPGANYAKLNDYLTRAEQDARAADPQHPYDVANDLNLDAVLAQATGLIKDRYPWLELAPDLATARKRNASLTLVMDLRARLATKTGGSTAVQIEVVAFDAQLKPVARFVTEGRNTATGPRGYGFAAAAGQALTALKGQSFTYFN